MVDRDCVTVTERTPGSGLAWGTVAIAFTPTVPHCSLASLIGLSIRAKLDADGILSPAPWTSGGSDGSPPSGGGLLVAAPAAVANGAGAPTGAVPSPRYYKLDVSVAPGTHTTAAEITKQLNDKERCAAALENPNLQRMVAGCMPPEVVTLAGR